MPPIMMVRVEKKNIKRESKILLIWVVAWDKRGSIDQVLKVYKDFDPALKQLISKVDESELKVWQLLDMEKLPSWTKAKLALLGDAAHPFTPREYSPTRAYNRRSYAHTEENKKRPRTRCRPSYRRCRGPRDRPSKGNLAVRCPGAAAAIREDPIRKSTHDPGILEASRKRLDRREASDRQ
jgi:hypothetical protein